MKYHGQGKKDQVLTLVDGDQVRVASQRVTLKTAIDLVRMSRLPYEITCIRHLPANAIYPANFKK